MVLISFLDRHGGETTACLFGAEQSGLRAGRLSSVDCSVNYNRSETPDPLINTTDSYNLSPSISDLCASDVKKSP